MSPLLIVIVVVLLALAIYRAFRLGYVLPAVTRKLHERGQHSLAIQTCERGLTLWSPLGNLGNFDLRFFLAYLLMEEYRYEEAEAHCRKLLIVPIPSLQSAARLRLADCLDGQQRTEEARRERETVQHLTGRNKDADILLQRAQLLADQNQHAEATQIYQNVLQSKAFVLGTQCAITNVRLALSAWNAGLYPTALEAAEKALAPKVLDSPLQQTAHNMAALALANLNRHQEAIVHVEQSLVLARKSGSEKAIAETLTQLGSLKMQVGQLNEAMQFANEAIPLSHKAQFNSRTLQAEILMAWGRYDDALAAFQAASRAPAFGIPQLAARTQATFALGIARIYNEKRDGATALDWLEKTREGFAGDAKLETWAQATRLWAISLLGDRPDFERNLALFESQLAVLPEDTTTQRVGLHAQAEAAHVWQNFPAMLDLWERYLALKPAPIDERRALYAIGEAQWMLDNPTRAHTAWEQAAATGIECFWSGLAKKRLAEFEQRALKPPA